MPSPPTAPTPEEDWRLMQRVAEGDEAAVAELYDRFNTLVFQAARQVLNSRAEAEDAVQEIFVRLWKTADRYDPTRAKLVTWVMLIARRHVIDRLRRRGVRPDHGVGEGPALDQSPAAEAARGPEESEREKIRARIAELPTLQRTVIERAYLQGFTLREISEQLEAPLGTVKSALSRGLGRLRDRLEDPGDQP
jgi:RNA polymerase sigma-70 factor (ECF subfamily)